MGIVLNIFPYYSICLCVTSVCYHLLSFYSSCDMLVSEQLHSESVLMGSPSVLCILPLWHMGILPIAAGVDTAVLAVLASFCLGSNPRQGCLYSPEARPIIVMAGGSKVTRRRHAAGEAAEILHLDWQITGIVSGTGPGLNFLIFLVIAKANFSRNGRGR